MAELTSFFKPQSVAIIGASRDPAKLGFGVTRNMIESGFRGELYLVNPKGGEVFGRKLERSIENLPVGIDLGIVVVPAQHVPETLIACSQREIKHFIIITGGFSEIGPEGEKIEQRVADLVEEEGLRLIGPNCIGILDTHWPLDTTFIQPFEFTPGEVAFITHSGALGAAMIDWARGAGFDFSRVISLGNQVDVDESDVVLPTAESEETKVVTMYLEGVRDGSKFIGNTSQASRLKPLIALKVGRSTAGQKAAASHTGAIAGADHAFDSAFRKSGILRAATTEQMFSWAKMFAWSNPPQNNRVAVLTNAGGPGVTATDALEDCGLVLADLSASTRAALSGNLPDAASTANPVDMLASASPEVYAGCLELVLEDEDVDMVLVIAPPPPMFDALDVAEKISPIIKRSQKPVAVALMGSELVAAAVEFLRGEKIPEFSFPEDAVSGLGALWAYQKHLAKDHSVREYKPAREERSAAKALLGELSGTAGFVDPELTTRLLEIYGLPVTGLHFASSGEQASETANRIGYPVVMKAAVEGLSHKSDSGGILLNLQINDEVRDGFALMEGRFSEITPDVEFGVHIQKMIPKGQEVITGAVRDPIFGPMVMFGSGGTDVEGLKDVSFALAPLTESDLDHLIQSTWAGQKLGGFRNIPPADIDAVKDILVRLCQIMIDFPDIEEIEVNPLIVLESGKGEWIVDARMVL